MVGFYDVFDELKYYVCPEDRFKTVSLYGMAGIGKTTLAKEVLKDRYVSDCFYCCAFVTIGPEYQLEEILKEILSQIDPNSHKRMLARGHEDKVREYVCCNRNLRYTRYLIVLDDVWSLEALDEFKASIPDDDEGMRSVFLITTRLKQVAHQSCSDPLCAIRVPFLDKEESWDLLRDNVFGEDRPLCPPDLRETGKKIAEICEGLPLLVVTVAKLLVKAEMTPDFWNRVAEKENSVFNDANDQIAEVLYPSYHYLPQHLQAFFLYMGLLPRVSLSVLAKWSSAEDFPQHKGSSENIALQILLELLSRNLVILHDDESLNHNGIKRYGMHCSFRCLSNREAKKNEFFYDLNTLADDGFAQEIESQGRLRIWNNVLFGVKGVHSSISAVRSILCIGPYHPYPVPICSNLRTTLRVVDALTVRFYNFPLQVLKLTQLRYLALTSDGNLPASISKLRNLRVFIVNRHASIITCSKNSWYLPMKIWDMQELEHLQITGSDLRPPSKASSSLVLLPNLVALLDVSAQSCTRGVLERIPNLRKLGIRVELGPDAVKHHFGFLDDIRDYLHKLETLKCVVVNPIVDVAAPRGLLPDLSRSIVKLSLSGLGYPWEDLSQISSLPNLRVLKLRCYAFRGPKWEVGVFEFEALRVLVIEDSDLVQWTMEDDRYCLQRLDQLTMKHCYKLQEIPKRVGEIVEKIELVECNPVAVTCAEQLKRYRDDLYYYSRCYFPLDLTVHSSWDDGKN